MSSSTDPQSRCLPALCCLRALGLHWPSRAHLLNTFPGGGCQTSVNSLVELTFSKMHTNLRGVGGNSPPETCRNPEFILSVHCNKQKNSETPVLFHSDELNFAATSAMANSEVWRRRWGSRPPPIASALAEPPPFWGVMCTRKSLSGWVGVDVEGPQAGETR